jgi:lysyl-tRNA synthetase class 2
MDELLRERLEWHARFTAEIRAFFTADGYVEVDTPILSPSLIPEPSIDVFETTYLPGKGEARPLWLAPSPELWMKRLLGQGSGRIFQVSRSFRNGDFGSPVHNPEFRLLEWYAEGRTNEESARETERLFGHLITRGLCRGEEARLAPPFARLSMAEAFAQFAGMDLAASQETGALRAACRGRGLSVGEDSTWEQAFHIAFLTLVEPELPVDRPLILSDYPSQIPTTSRSRPGTPWAERWELYAAGVELANCYTEETDPVTLRARLEEEAERQAGARIVPRPDIGLADAFPPGTPPCSGTALGVDRLEMLFRGEKSLEGVIFFPFSVIMGPQSNKG